MCYGQTVRPRAVVTIDNTTAYRKSHMGNRLVFGTKMNDLDLCLEVVSTSA